jgi:hypothetical protein
MLRTTNVVRTVWKESLEWCGPYPVSRKRFFKIETLISALEKALGERDRFFHAGLQAAIKSAPLSSVRGDIVYEDSLRLVMAITATYRTNKQSSFRLVIAKNHQECSAALKTEYECLMRLSQRIPDGVIGLQACGTLFLPDRHRRKDFNREPFAYFTDNPSGAVPLYVASPTQLGPRSLQPRRFSLMDTEHIKCALAYFIAGSYDPKSGTGLDIASLTAENIAVQKKEKMPRVLFISGGRMRKHLRPEVLVQQLLWGTLENEGVVFPLAPANPGHFFKALAEAATQEQAETWCRAFLRKVPHLEAGLLQSTLPGRQYFEVLQESMESYKNKP